MKKYLYAATITFLLTTPTWATTKCVNTSLSCSHRDYQAYMIDWGVTCNRYYINGLAICGFTEGTTEGEVRGHFGTKNKGNSEDIYCWCKMLSPIVSKWVFVRKYDSETACAGDCGSYCSYYTLNNYASTRDTMFANPLQ